MKIKLWQDWVMLVAAAWLYVSPFVLGIGTVSHPAAALAWTCAVVIMIAASEALVVTDVLESWAGALAGIALVAGPWALGFSPEAAPTINSVAAGVVVVTCALSAVVRDRRASAGTRR